MCLFFRSVSSTFSPGIRKVRPSPFTENRITLDWNKKVCVRLCMYEECMCCICNLVVTFSYMKDTIVYIVIHVDLFFICITSRFNKVVVSDTVELHDLRTVHVTV